MTADSPIQDGFIDLPDGRYYRIADFERLPTFFINLVTASEQWLFVASNGALTAGRSNAEHALFPYQTVDRIYDSARINGPFTALWCTNGDGAGETLWEPFASHTPRIHRVTRHLYKSIEGDRIWFEEINHILGLTFRHGWAAAGECGFVRRAVLLNQGAVARRIRLLDGLRNLLVPGIGRRLQNEISCLADAYKSAERLPDSTLAAYTLSSAIVDRAVPVESLRATVAWSFGLVPDAILLSDAQLDRFLAGQPVIDESRRRGVRSTYALVASLELAPSVTQVWSIVADLGLDHAAVVRLRADLSAGTAAASVAHALAENTRRLRSFVGGSDGLQLTGDEAATAHHFANTLFNIMRGGVFPHGHDVPAADFGAFARLRNIDVSTRQRDFLVGLPASLPIDALQARAAATGDADLIRLADEYLPIAFSRRHGDPSRPWNQFNIVLRDTDGRLILNHEGNWRDIFQNWEALALSYPAFLENMIATFLNASGADGYNAYRIGRHGIDWEAPEPENPWAGIGYWGDHQTIYLLRLLEWSGRFHPGRLAAWLRQPRFASAAIPYRIAGYEDMRGDPRRTITFDFERHDAIITRAARLGADARLITGADGRVAHVSLAEKLILSWLVRLSNFVPGGGIWMNTQRPEWNDANNALVGYGVSIVTLAQLRRFLAHWLDIHQAALGSEALPLSAGVVRLAHAIASAFSDHESLLAAPAIPATAARALLDRFAVAGTEHRTALYNRGLEAPLPVDPSFIAGLARRALAFVDHTLRLNRRPDGLYHSYNLLSFHEEPASLEISHLQPMLEGQVAVLGAGVLTATETVQLLDALRASALYRADQQSYLLYPDRELDGFLARNRIPTEAVTGNRLLHALIDAGDRRIVLHDADGAFRFQADLVNAEALSQRLDQLAQEPAWRTLVDEQRVATLAAYEAVFHHHAFTGRSGSMFGYEGLGCIYWHMISKLLLAVQENLDAARAAGDPATAYLELHYNAIRDGLGYRRSAALYGAFPTDPYSHTPGHSGARQPGMTGQVKEELITRWGELGISVANGHLSLDPRRVGPTEFLTHPQPFHYVDVQGIAQSLPVGTGELAFTLCAVPVVYRRQATAAPGITVHLRDQSPRHFPGRHLDQECSALVFARSGAVLRIEVAVGFVSPP